MCEPVEGNCFLNVQLGRKKKTADSEGGSSPSDGEALAAGRASVTSGAARYTLSDPAGKKQRSLRETR